MSSKINAERTHSTFQKIAYYSKLIIQLFPPSVTSQTTSQTMESHISFEWKNLDIISSQCKVGPFFRCVFGVKKGNIGLKWVDNSGREIISIRNNATLVYGINGQSTTSTSASNNNVINHFTIFISEKFKGQWYFKLNIAEFEFDYANKNKIENIHRQNT